MHVQIAYYRNNERITERYEWDGKREIGNEECVRWTNERTDGSEKKQKKNFFFDDQMVRV